MAQWLQYQMLQKWHIKLSVARVVILQFINNNLEHIQVVIYRMRPTLCDFFPPQWACIT